MLHIFLVSLITLFTANSALADKPVPWQIGLQEAATPMMEKLTEFHNLLLVIIFATAIFVTILIVYVCFRFNAKRNPVPSKTSHNTLLEIIWTTIPIIILVIIAIPSLKVLYHNEIIEDADMTLKVIGNQWYWSYQYPDNGNIAFDSYIIPDEDIKPGQLRLLEVDNRVVLPVDTTIRIQTTSADVIHDWAIPAFGLKIDAVPGRLNESWTRIEKPGVYYGQCSELCGTGHGFMPITVQAVSRAEFKAWVRSKTNKFAASESEKVASATDTIE